MSIEKTLLSATDKMSGAIDVREYMHIALGLLFLRYVSKAPARRHDLISEEFGAPECRDKYLAENTFFVPPSPRWSYLATGSNGARVGVMIDDAVRESKAKTLSFKGAWPKVFGREGLYMRLHDDLLRAQVLAR